MDRRTLLAFFLTALVIVLTPLLFRRGAKQTATVNGQPTDTVKSSAAAAAAAAPAAAPTPAAAPATLPAIPRGETTTVALANAQYVFSSVGAGPHAVRLTAYSNLRPGAPRDARATLTTAGPGAQTAAQLLRFRAVIGADTVRLDTIPFHIERSGDAITFSSAGTPSITLKYQFTGDGYLTHVNGRVGGAGSAAAEQLLIDLPPTLRPQDADT